MFVVYDAVVTTVILSKDKIESKNISLSDIENLNLKMSYLGKASSIMRYDRPTKKKSKEILPKDKIESKSVLL